MGLLWTVYAKLFLYDPLATRWPVNMVNTELKPFKFLLLDQ